MILNALETYKKILICETSMQNKVTGQTLENLIKSLLIITCHRKDYDHLKSLVSCWGFFNYFKSFHEFSSRSNTFHSTEKFNSSSAKPTQPSQSHMSSVVDSLSAQQSHKTFCSQNFHGLSKNKTSRTWISTSTSPSISPWITTMSTENLREFSSAPMTWTSWVITITWWRIFWDLRWVFLRGLRILCVENCIKVLMNHWKNRWYVVKCQ